ncbi:DnaJ C-terminal domain-containing protein [Streptomyces sp. NPDC004296]|uniref:DnaJ C-terminal domain-containing protein n=1 Tax=Streptomyces sp. NPDC004296 TaxID=3364697 RepID=UPI0036C98E6C
MKDTRTLRVRIPAGVRAGQQLRLRSMGMPGKNGGAPGDLDQAAHRLTNADTSGQRARSPSRVRPATEWSRFGDVAAGAPVQHGDESDGVDEHDRPADRAPRRLADERAGWVSSTPQRLERPA